LIELRKHILLKCYYEEILKLNIEQDSKNKIKIINNNNSNNTTLINSGNTINQYNIYVGIDKNKKLIPFTEEWDTSLISEDIISGIITSKYMYTKLLTEILNNEINLNVIMDRDSKTGLVYLDEINKYKEMKLTDIVENTMKKLKEQLLVLNEDNETLFEEIKDFSRKMITKKYNDYKNNINNTKCLVNNLMNNTYAENKNKAVELFDNYVHTPPMNDCMSDKGF